MFEKDLLIIYVYFQSCRLLFWNVCKMFNFLYVFHIICNKSYSSFAPGITEAPFAFSSYVRCWKVAYVMNYGSWFLSELYKLSWKKHNSVIFSRNIGRDNLACVFCCTAILDFEHFINKLTWPCIWLSTRNYRRYAGLGSRLGHTETLKSGTCVLSTSCTTLIFGCREKFTRGAAIDLASMQ